ncbi:MAG: glycosyltransferase family 39 protein [Acidimicrobiales bacterium]|nr:glycosyltransferase family 39 protein [Acidimicrobiales bacterium]
MSTAARHRPRWWIIGLVLVGVVAFGVRAANVLLWYPTCDVDIITSAETGTPYPECPFGEYRLWGDSAYGYLQGYLLSQGEGYADSATWFASDASRIVDSAGDPPLFAAVLAVVHRLGIHSVTAHRLATSLLGTVGVVLMALVGARIAGRRAGLIAGGLAAVYPLLWINDAMLLSESLFVPVIALVLLAAYRFWDVPDRGNAGWLGAAIAFAALTRGEALLLFGVLVLPLVWGLRRQGWKRPAALVGIVWGVGALLIAPWIVYNLSRFERPVLMTSQTGAVLAAGACDVAFYGESLGYYGADCYSEYVRKGYAIGHPLLPGCDADAVAALDSLDPAVRERARACWPDPAALDESERDTVSADLAGRYLDEHRERLPVVMVARVARMFDVYNPDLGSELEPLGQNVQLNWAVEGRGKWQSRAGFVFWWLLVVPAVAGAVVLVRRRIPVSPLLAMPVVITVTAALAFGVTRYRMPVDVSVVVLGAVALEALVRRWWAAPDDATVRRRGVPVPARDASAEAPNDVAGVMDPPVVAP